MLYLLFMLPPLIFMLYAQAKVSSAYKKYSLVPNMGGVIGVQDYYLDRGIPVCCRCAFRPGYSTRGV